MPNSEMIPLILESMLLDIIFLDLCFEVGFINIDFDLQGSFGYYKLTAEISVFFS